MAISGGFSGRLLGPLLKNRSLLIENLLKRLSKSVLMLLGLTVAASATGAAIHNEMFGSSTHLLDLASHTILKISNEEMNDIMKIVKSLEESCLLIKGVSEVIQNEAIEQKDRFLSMLLDTSGASLLWNLSAGKREILAGEGTTRTR